MNKLRVFGKKDQTRSAPKMITNKRKKEKKGG